MLNKDSKNYNKEIFGITLTRNDNFIVNDEDDTLKNCLSFGKGSAIQSRIQSSNEIRTNQINPEDNNMNKIPLPKEELN